MSISGYKLTYEIQIGRYLFRTGINAVSIESSWKSLTDTATITLPRNLYALRDNKRFDFSRDLITDHFASGDRVDIKLGYNGQNIREFIGYVREPEASVPIVLHCEDEMYKLKRSRITRNFERISLRALLREVCPGYQIDCPEVLFEDYVIQNATPARILENLKNYNLYARFALDGVLRVDYPYNRSYDRHIFSFQQNIRESNLRYRKADNIRLLIKAIANRHSGKKEVYEFGDRDGEVRTLNFGDISTEQLRTYAHAEARKFKFDGYYGDFTSWGRPVTRHGDVAVIRNSRYPDRNGSFYIDDVKISFDESGFKRTNTLGPKAA